MSGRGADAEVVLVQKSLRRGHEFFYEGYVHDVAVARDERGGLVFVRFKCWASQKKSITYKQSLVLEEKDEGCQPYEVAFAKCMGCPAGGDGGLCHHIFALLMVLDYYSPRPECEMLPGPVSVTSQACGWGPRQQIVDSQPSMQTVVEKSKMAGERKKKPVTCSLFEARGPNVRLTTPKMVNDLRMSLPKNCRLRALLPEGGAPFPMVRRAFGPTAKGSILSYPLLFVKQRGDCYPTEEVDHVYSL